MNWTDEVWFKDENKSAIDGAINRERFNIKCSICKEPKYTGSVLHCDYKTCGYCFHVRCAIEKGLIKEWD